MTAAQSCRIFSFAHRDDGEPIDTIGTMVDLHDEIRAVLVGATRGKNRRVRGVLTAYQILHLLPVTVRESLIKKYAAPGKGARAHFSAASAVAKAISGTVGPGNLTCRRWRCRTPHVADAMNYFTRIRVATF